MFGGLAERMVQSARAPTGAAEAAAVPNAKEVPMETDRSPRFDDRNLFGSTARDRRLNYFERFLDRNRGPKPLLRRA